MTRIICLLAILTVAATGVSATPQDAIVIGYYVDYVPSSLPSLMEGGHVINYVVPMTFHMTTSWGTLTQGHNAAMDAFARSRGIKILAGVTNVRHRRPDERMIHAMLNSPLRRAALISEIVALVQRLRYDGVHIDFENVPAADRESLTKFVQDTAESLHARGKLVTIAVPPQTRDDVRDPSRGAFDYRALGWLSDLIVVMAYDQHYSSGQPGPVASLPWVQEVVRFTVSQVPPSRVVLGVPLYGYEWPLRRRARAQAFGYGTIMARAAERGATVHWDDGAKVPYYATSKHVVWFEDARSMEYKVDFAQQQQLAGVAVWRLGLEDPHVWESLSDRYRR